MFYSVVGVVTAAFIVGGVHLAMGQSAVKKEVEHLKDVQEASAAAIATVPVTALKIEYIQDDIEEIRNDQKAILEALKKHSDEGG